MGRYRKVEVKTWADGKFRELSPIPPCGQGLWLWFLTGTRTTNIPGVVIGTDQVMAAELRWPVEAFREAFREAFAKGMAKGDWEAGLVWLPNASRPGDNRNKPESPNVIRSWRDTWDEIPECALKLEVWQQLKAFAEAFGKGFGEAFLEACRKPWVKPSGKPSPNQEQEQEQEQNHSPPTPLTGGAGVGAVPVRNGESRSPRDAWRDVTECDPQAYQTWLEWRAEEHDVVPPRVRIQDAKFLGGKGSPEQQRGYIDELIRLRFKRLHDPIERRSTSGGANPNRSTTAFEQRMAALDADIAAEEKSP